MSEINFFDNLADGFVRSKQKRERNKNNLLSFGIDFLDDCLGGILRSDVCVLTAESGAGKSEVVTHIAYHNAVLGKNVYLFALEAERDEISMRLGFKALAQKFYQTRVVPGGEKPNYLEWILGRQDHLLGKFEDEVLGEFQSVTKLQVAYRGESFNIGDFEKYLMGIKSNADLIILDHLHFLDFDDENENRAYKNILKKIRELAILYDVPILLVAHLRKRDKRFPSIVPDMEDIFGSSDIFKIATRTVAIAPAWDIVFSSSSGFRIGTYMKAGKIRQDGSRRRYCGLTTFDVSENKYEPGYRIGTISFDGTEWAECKNDERPFWAKRAKQNNSYLGGSYATN